jgi:PAS domain S-box-containing protein
MMEDSKTKEELIREVEILKERVSELISSEEVWRRALYAANEKVDQYFPQMEHMSEAIFVVFGRKLEFINDRFAKLFSVSPEEACSEDFNPMTLIEPEDRTVVWEHYREGSRGAYTMKQFEFTGLSKDGLKIECEAVAMFIPYKWGTAMHGMLRDISVQTRIDEALQRRRYNLPRALNTIPTNEVYTDFQLNAR